jgi:uncharacterized protein YjbI with pentapeptide repeats
VSDSPSHTTRELVELLRNDVAGFNAWRSAHPDARIDFDGVNLYRANLFGANLREASLRGANLFGANLHGANLYGANLRGANLYGTDLTGANLARANLWAVLGLSRDFFEAWVEDLRGSIEFAQ